MVFPKIGLDTCMLSSIIIPWDKNGFGFPRKEPAGSSGFARDPRKPMPNNKSSTESISIESYYMIEFVSMKFTWEIIRWNVACYMSINPFSKFNILINVNI